MKNPPSSTTSQEKISTHPIIVIDTETTGLSPTSDELLQVSIIDAESSVILLDEYFCPKEKTEWPEAEAINHISPAMLVNKPYFEEKREAINTIISTAEVIIGYNPNFDIRFLMEYGLCFDGIKVIDVMEDYAAFLGEDDPTRPGKYKRKKLTDCASALGFTWDHLDPHNSLADCYATLYCYNAMNELRHISSH